MNESQIHDAIGELAEELIEPVAKLRRKKRYPVTGWVAAAACFCLLLTIPWGWMSRNGMKAESAGSPAEPEINQENKYSGILDDAGTAAVSDAIFRAKVLQVHEKYVLVEPLEGEMELLCSDKIEVSCGTMEQLPLMAAGDTVEIIYDGLIQETYPARITGTYGIQVVEQSTDIE